MLSFRNVAMIMMSLHSNGSPKKFVPGTGVLLLIGLTMLLFGGIRNLWDFRLEKQMDILSRAYGPSSSKEDSGAEGDLNCRGLVREVSEKNFSVLPWLWCIFKAIERCLKQQ
jgi:hypothetical protein|uniref:Uncharacterized protein n=1 Tax=Mus musculus TaxID=10090 RepID=Q78R00_MOUSE|nr:unnamed protein product [Mus musculus]